MSFEHLLLTQAVGFPVKKAQVLIWHEDWEFTGRRAEWEEDNRGPIYGAVDEPSCEYLLPVKREFEDSVLNSRDAIIDNGWIVCRANNANTELDVANVYLGYHNRVIPPTDIVLAY